MSKLKVVIENYGESIKEFEGKRVEIFHRGNRYCLVERDGKLEILASEPLKITLGGGCNLLYLEQDL